MKFRKTLAKFYCIWFRDCYDSIDYCVAHGCSERAQYYRDRAKLLFNLINENWDAIEYFSVGDRAFLYDSVHPREFQGYL